MSAHPQHALGSLPAIDLGAEAANFQTGLLERLPKPVNLVPMVLQWLWLSIRHRSWTLPAAVNPAITAGGLAGEGKSEYFRIMGPLARAATADFAVLANNPAGALREAECLMQKEGLDYPLIVKPDIGWCGFGVRLVRSRGELAHYLEAFPPHESVILQRFIPHDGEAGIYYVRHPGAQSGRISGILLRYYPRVTGDGRRTIGELIAQHPRARRLGRDGRSEPCCDISRVPAAGEMVRISVTGSTRVGGLYQDATGLITPELESAVQRIVMDMEDVHVARFDVRYETLAGLLGGKNFTIIEVNGAGSEAVHAWDPKYSLAEAYRIVFRKQRMLFEIGAAMRKRGHAPPGSFAVARLYLRQAKLIRRYPLSN